MTTSAIGGAGGDTAISGVVAIAVTANETIAPSASMSGGTLDAKGDVTVGASHTGSADTPGDRQYGVGRHWRRHLARPHRGDRQRARHHCAQHQFERRRGELQLAHGFDPTRRAPRRAWRAAKADKEEDKKAEAKDGDDQGGGIDNQIHNQNKSADKRATSTGADKGTTGDTDGKSSSKTSSGAVQFAGAVGVTVALTRSEAVIGNGLTIQAGKEVAVETANQTDAIATGDGAATTSEGGTGIGIGIAVNFAEVTNTATIGTGAIIISNGLTAVAGGAERDVKVETESVDIVDYEEDTIFVGTGHGLKTGDKVTYQQSATASTEEIGGLDDNKAYYVVDVGNGKIKLAEDKDKLSDTVDLTELAEDKTIGDDHKLERSGLLDTGLLAGDPIVFDPGAENVRLDLGKASALYTGDAVVANKLDGLDEGKTYYVIRLEDNNAALALSREDALAGKAITLAESKVEGQKLVDGVSGFRAEARSGASGGDTGVAGSVAVNIALLKNEATVKAASVTLGGGDVKLGAESNTVSTASATPRDSKAASGADLGVGASFAINIEIGSTRAEIVDSATVTMAAADKSLGEVSVDVTSDHVMHTEARTGAASSGGTAIGGAVAFSWSEHDTVARLGDGTNLKLSGDAGISASHSADLTTRVDSEASGKGAGIGVSVAIVVGLDDTAAVLGGKLESSAGKATVIAAHAVSSDVEAKGSAKGAEGGDKKDEEGKTTEEAPTADDETKKNTDFAGERSGSKSAVSAPSANEQVGKGNTDADGASSKNDSSGSKGGSGSNIKVAAAVGVTYMESASRAEVEDGAVIKASKAVEVKSTNETDASTKAIGLAMASSDAEKTEGGGDKGGEDTGGGDTGGKEGGDTTAVAAGVGLNIVIVDSTARIGNADVTGGGITVEAATPVGKSHDFTAWGIAGAGAQQSGGGSGSSTAVAGGVAINVIDIETTATAATGADLRSSAGIDVTARSNAGIQAIGAAGAVSIGGSGGAGVGVGVVVNYLQNTTEASIGDADADAAGAIALVSDASINPLNLLHPPIVFGASAVNAGTDSFNIPDHHMTTGNEVVYHQGTGAIGGDLVDGDHYFVRVAGDGTFKLFDTEEHAKGDTTDGLVAISSAGSGAGHSFEKTGFDLGVTSLAAGGGVSQKGPGVAGSFIVNVFDSDTTAYIAGGAGINQRNVLLGIPSTTAQDVSVSATDAMKVWDLAGALAASLESAGIGAAIDVQVLLQDTNAYIGSNALVDAGGNVTVRANSSQEQFGIAAAIGASSDSVGIAGSVLVWVDQNNTRAYIGNNAVVDADGSVVVEASSDSSITTIAGSVAVSGSSSSVGVSVSVLVHEDNVEAYIGDAAQVTARGNDGTTAVQTGTRDGSGNRITQNARGVAITATSFEDLVTIAAGASVGSSVGVGGSVNVNVLDEDTKAWIGAGALVNNSLTDANIEQDALLRASDATDQISVAGGVQYGGTGGFGAGVDIGVYHKDTYAYVADGAVLRAKDDVVIEAQSNEELLSVAANIGAGGFAVALSASIFDIHSNTKAYVGSGATVAADGDMSVSADDTATFTMIAGSAGVGTSSGGVGVANTTLVHSDLVEAYIGANSKVTALGSSGLALEATSSEDLLVISGALGAGSSVGAAGSASVSVMNEHTHAYIADGAKINLVNTDAAVGQDVSVKAQDDTTILGVAGVIAVGGTGGVGAGADVGVLTKDTLAYIGGATVNARDDVVVEAKSSESIISVAATVGAGGSVGVAGSGSVQVVDVKTRAFIGNDAQTLTSGVANVVANGNVVVSAVDETSTDQIAGSIAGAGGVAVGAAAAVIVLTKTTEAFIGENANVTGKGLNDASTVHTGGFSVGTVSDTLAFASAKIDGTDENEKINLGGSHGLATGDAVTFRATGDDPDSSTDNVGSLQNNKTYYARVDGDNVQLFETKSQAMGTAATGRVNLATPGSPTADYALVKGSADVPRADKDDPSNMRGSKIGVTSPGAPKSGTDLSSDTTEDGADTGALTGQRTATAGTTGVRGVAVTAINKDDVASIGVSGAAAGTVAVALSGGVNVISNNTSAHIDQNANINGADGAGADQSVLVAAGNDFHRLGIVAAISGGTVGVAAGADVSIITNTTTAYIDDGAEVSASRDVVVDARATEEYLTVAAGGGGGLVGIGGAVSVLSSNATTHAYIGDDATAGNGTSVSAGGNVLVSAKSDTETLTVTGAISIGGVGIGGSVAVTSLDKDTQAWIGSNAQVNALGNGGTLAGVYTGLQDDGDFDKTNLFRGVAVQAASSEDLFTISATASGGVYFGLAGGVSVSSVDSDTVAFIGDGARINQPPEHRFNPQLAGTVHVGNNTINVGADHGLLVGDVVVYGNGGGANIGNLANGGTYYIAEVSGNNVKLAATPGGAVIDLTGIGTGTNHSLRSAGHALQSVAVNAVNEFSAFSFAGGLAVGFVGIGGGVDVGVVRNDTTAYIGNNAKVGARSDVDVNALADRDIDAVAIAVAGGAVAAAGSVSVWSIGDAVDSNYSVSQRNEEGNETGAKSGDALAASGAAFDGSGGVGSNTITLDGKHSYQTGDALVYDSGVLENGNNASAVSGLVDGQTYYVIRVDESGTAIRSARPTRTS